MKLRRRPPASSSWVAVGYQSRQLGSKIAALARGGWGARLEGAGAWACQVMEYAADDGDRQGALVPLDGGRGYFPATSKPDAQHIRWCLTDFAGVDPALVSVITGADALRRAARPEDAVRLR